MKDETKEAIEVFRSAREYFDSTDFRGSDLQAEIQLRNILDQVSAAATRAVKPHEVVALKVAALRLAIAVVEAVLKTDSDAPATKARDALEHTLRNMCDELEQYACICGGSGMIINGDSRDPASAKVCPDCQSRGEEAAQLAKTA